MLRAIGGDCAGAVSFHEIGEDQNIRIYNKIECTPLSKNELMQIIEELPTKPYMERRMSLAGVQEKTAVCIVDGKIGLPVGDMPTTHILKPATKFKQSVANEYICMKTATTVGLSVAEVEVRKVNEIEFLLIKKFDRFKGTQIVRLPQEDFAQASGVWAENKYDFTFKDCLKIIEQTIEPALQKQMFIRGVIFNFLIGNCDAHAKNFSLF